MNKDPKNEWHELVDRIVSSKSFGKSAVYVNLLRFLVESTLNEDVPKETAIAAHLFGKDKPTQDTSQIRVYIYHLRKKLHQYFEEEGDLETYTLSIPKGGYEVELSQKAKGRKHQTIRWLPVLLVSLLIVSFGLNAYLLWSKGAIVRTGFTESQAFWTDFIETDVPTMAVLGDLFVFVEKDLATGVARTIRVPDVNDQAQYEAYRDSVANEGLELDELSYTYLIKNSVDWVDRLTRVFFGKKNFNTRVISRVDARDLHDYNMVFIGMQKTAGMFNDYFNESRFSLLNEGRRGYAITIDGEEKVYQPFGDADQKHTDYGFIAKYPGPNNNVVLMFGGIWDTATSQSLEMLTNPAKAKEVEDYLMKEFDEVPPYFELLIEVSGIDRVGFDSKIVYANKVDF
ncbi:MAG: hypothetical protein AAGA66_09780 [Bacteroidota bacterium]